MKKNIFCTFSLLLCCLLAHSTIIFLQDFEGSQDNNWAYQADPQPSRLVWWGPSDQPIGGANAQSGAWYWGSWDLDNITHSLTFAALALSPLNTYTLQFYYYSRNLDLNTDLMRYALEYDNGSIWQNWVNLQPNTSGWTLVRIELPAYAQVMRFRLEAKYDGLNKYLHWDNIGLDAVQTEALAPYVYNVQASQRTDGSKLVDIYYDIMDANLDPITVSLIVSADGGQSFSHSPAPQNLSGDVGDNILNGENKHIVWNAAADGIDFVGNLFRVRLLAEDHTTMGTVQTPTFNPPEGTYFGATTIRIRSATNGAGIYYTLDGTEPNESSILYTAPISLTESSILKARAYLNNWIPSATSSADYSIIAEPPANFVLVPGGTFTMGRAYGEGNDNELPVHVVSLAPFYISKYEVTQAEYSETMGTLPLQDAGVGPNNPVHRINWYQTIIYCNKRSIAEGLEPAYSISGSSNPVQWGEAPFTNSETWNSVICDWNATGYRLLTEAEWEYAARGATNSPDYLYSGSNDLNQVAWYIDNSNSSTQPVGQKSPNQLGLYDMSGNVTEFVWDWFSAAYYSESPGTNPTGPETGLYRIGRGGAWNTGAASCRVAFRPAAGPQYTHRNIGFRVCRRASF